MIANYFRPKSLLAAFAVSILTAPAGAAELADLAGDWTLSELLGPTRLRETFYNPDTDTSRDGDDSLDFAAAGEILVNAYYPNEFLTETRDFNISPTGVVSGGENGTIVSFSSNRILYAGNGELTTVYSNMTGDVLLASGRDEDQQEQIVGLKRPSSFAVVDVAGAWHVISTISPRNLSKNFVDGRLVDTFFVAESSLIDGSIEINTGGGFTGLFSGTIAGTASGDITVTTAEGGIPFRINASKNLMAATPGDGDEQEYILLVKKPSSLTTSELAGTWRVSSFQIPTTLVETYLNPDSGQSRQADNSDFAQSGEFLVDLFHPAGFEVNRQHVVIDASGTITGTETGALSARPDRSVQISLGDGDGLTLHPNADKTVLIGASPDVEGESKEIIVAIKTNGTMPTNFEELVDLKTVEPTDGELIFSWNSSDNTQLEASGTLSGFSEVMEASGGDAFSVDTTGGGSMFFRVAERPKEP